MMVFKYNLTTFSLDKPHPHPNDVWQKAKEIQVRRESRFDVQIAHGSFNKQQLENKMQRDTVYIATLRHPFLQFRSHYFYSQRRKSFSVVQRDFLSLIKNSTYDPITNRLKLKSNINMENSMFKYFRFDTNEALLNQTYFQECLYSLANLFQIIITEYFDESLLLLKEELCWDIKDIIYLSHKNASFPSKSKNPDEYGILYERHKNISYLDYELYDFFLQIQKQRIEKAGREFEKKLLLYQKIKKNTTAFCLKIYNALINETNYFILQKILTRTIFVDGFNIFDSFNISGHDCVMMSLCEGTYEDARLVLNYPTLCTRHIHGIQPNAIFCQGRIKDRETTFHHNNLSFRLTHLKSLLSCDMIITYN